MATYPGFKSLSLRQQRTIINIDLLGPPPRQVEVFFCAPEWSRALKKRWMLFASAGSVRHMTVRKMLSGAWQVRVYRGQDEQGKQTRDASDAVRHTLREPSLSSLLQPKSHGKGWWAGDERGFL